MIAVPGHSCWRQERAERAAFLVDGQAYFDAFAAAAERAEHSIIVLAWDFHGGVCLRADDRGCLTTRLDEFLNGLVSRRRNLEVCVLDWDYPALYATERQFLPTYRFDWWTHRRFHFHLDSNHAAGGSHHQKVVVIDDAIAFVGGIDFAPGRWDTPSHTCDDTRRVTPSGDACGPYHDLMMAVDGDAAAALGELARERWFRATGKRLRAARSRTDRWPDQVRVDLRDVTVSIARTEPDSPGRAEVREIETLYVDTIAAAQKWIYIENQYLTAERVGQALCRRLREPSGPEIVIVTTQMCGGWLEESTMGVLRARLVERLLAADRFKRLRLFAPMVPGLTESRYTVHAKAMIVDDVFVRVGSANLNNRSMGLDTECDLAVEAEGDASVARGIAMFRSRLLAEHLCVSAETVSASLARTDSLIATIDDLRGGEHTLVPLDHTVPQWLQSVMPEAAIVDPDRPLDAQIILEKIAPALPDLAPHSQPWLFVVLAIVSMSLAWAIGVENSWALAGALGVGGIAMVAVSRKRSGSRRQRRKYRRGRSAKGGLALATIKPKRGTASASRRLRQSSERMAAIDPRKSADDPMQRATGGSDASIRPSARPPDGSRSDPGRGPDGARGKSAAAEKRRSTRLAGARSATGVPTR